MKCYICGVQDAALAVHSRECWACTEALDQMFNQIEFPELEFPDHGSAA